MPLLISVNLMEPLRGSTTVYVLYRHTLPTRLEINYDVQSSDHYPLSICVDVNNIPKVETTMQHSTVKCNWGKATDSQLSEYTTNCETK